MDKETVLPKFKAFVKIKELKNVNKVQILFSNDISQRIFFKS